MGKVHIVDCTIRDGGYLLDKNSSPEFVRGILQGLVDAGIDYTETGFLQSKHNGETIVYHNSRMWSSICRWMPNAPRILDFAIIAVIHQRSWMSVTESLSNGCVYHLQNMKLRHH